MEDAPYDQKMSMLERWARHRDEHRLAYRLLLYVVICSSVFTLATTGIQLYHDYNFEVGRIENRLSLIAVAHLEGLTASHWAADDEQTRTQLHGLLQLPDLIYAEVRSAQSGPVLALGHWDLDDSTMRQEYPMVYQTGDLENHIGTLTVVAALDGPRRRIRERALRILSAQAVQTLALSMAIVLVVQLFLTRHLRTLGTYAQNLDLDAPGPTLKLDRQAPTKRPPDELDHVVTAIRGMHQRLIDDVTALRLAESAQTDLICDLEAKNEELERFSYTVSHDLKGPLITVRGFLGLLERALSEGDLEQAQGSIRKLYSASEKMSILLEDLLELSRVGQVVRTGEVVSLGEAAHEATDLLVGQAASRGVTVDIAEDLPDVYGDRVRLVQVFQNLISNAIKYMGDQEEPRVLIRPMGRERLEPGQVGCYVRDNGVGIDAKHLESAFDLFRRLGSAGEGTGIGLALVRRILEAHGGRVWLESAGAGRGSAVCLVLPEVAEEER